MAHQMLLWQRPQYHRWLQALAWATAHAVLITQLAWADPYLLNQSSSARSSKPTVSLPLNLTRLTLPEQLGHIVERWAPADATATTPVVIHIQDLHAEPTTQRTLAKLLAHLHKTLGMSLVAVEGAAGPCETEVFSAFPDRRLNERIARLFLQEGLFTGAEYAAITQPDVLSLVGVEDPSLYLKHLAVYHEGTATRVLAQRLEPPLREMLTALKAKLYPPLIRALDQQRDAYEAGRLSFKDYLAALQRTADRVGLSLTMYPTLMRFTELYALEPWLDLPQVEAEQGQFLQLLRAEAKASDVAALAVVSQQVQQDHVPPVAFYRQLAQLARQYHVPWEDQPPPTPSMGQWLSRVMGIASADEAGPFTHLARYARYLELSDAVQVDVASRELEQCFRALLDAALTSPAQQELAAIDQYLAVLLHLHEARLSREELAAYEASRREFTALRLTDFFTAHERVLPRRLRVQLQTLMANLVEVAVRVHAHEQFYDLAAARDRQLITHTLALLTPQQRTQSQVVALVAGGFHTQGMLELLRQRHVAYVVIAPKVSGELDESLYTALLANQVPSVNELLQKLNTTSLVQPLATNTIANDRPVQTTTPDPLVQAETRRTGKPPSKKSFVLLAWAFLQLAQLVKSGKSSAEVAAVFRKPQLAAVYDVRADALPGRLSLNGIPVEIITDHDGQATARVVAPDPPAAVATGPAASVPTVTASVPTSRWAHVTRLLRHPVARVVFIGGLMMLGVPGMALAHTFSRGPQGELIATPAVWDPATPAANTLGGIARDLHVAGGQPSHWADLKPTIEAIADAQHPKITDIHRIYPGQHIEIPSTSSEVIAKLTGGQLPSPPTGAEVLPPAHVPTPTPSVTPTPSAAPTVTPTAPAATPSPEAMTPMSAPTVTPEAVTTPHAPAPSVERAGFFDQIAHWISQHPFETVLIGLGLVVLAAVLSYYIGKRRGAKVAPDVARARAEVATAKTELKRVTAELKAAQQQLETATQELAQRQEALRKIEAQLTKLTKEQTALEGRHAQLTKDVAELTTKRDEIGQALEQARREHETLQRALTKLREEHTTLTQQYAELQAALAKARADLAQAQKELAEVKAALGKNKGALEAEIMQLLERKQALETNIRELEATHRELLASMERAKGELAELKQAIAAATLTLERQRREQLALELTVVSLKHEQMILALQNRILAELSTSLRTEEATAKADALRATIQQAPLLETQEREALLAAVTQRVDEVAAAHQARLQRAETLGALSGRIADELTTSVSREAVAVKAEELQAAIQTAAVLSEEDRSVLRDLLAKRLQALEAARTKAPPPDTGPPETPVPPRPVEPGQIAELPETVLKEAAPLAVGQPGPQAPVETEAALPSAQPPTPVVTPSEAAEDFEGALKHLGAIEQQLKEAKDNKRFFKYTEVPAPTPDRWIALLNAEARLNAEYAAAVEQLLSLSKQVPITFNEEGLPQLQPGALLYRSDLKEVHRFREYIADTRPRKGLPPGSAVSLKEIDISSLDLNRRASGAGMIDVVIMMPQFREQAEAGTIVQLVSASRSLPLPVSPAPPPPPLTETPTLAGAEEVPAVPTEAPAAPTEPAAPAMAPTAPIAPWFDDLEGALEPETPSEAPVEVAPVPTPPRLPVTRRTLRERVNRLLDQVPPAILQQLQDRLWLTRQILEMQFVTRYDEEPLPTEFETTLKTLEQHGAIAAARLQSKDYAEFKGVLSQAGVRGTFDAPDRVITLPDTDYELRLSSGDAADLLRGYFSGDCTNCGLPRDDADPRTHSPKSPFVHYLLHQLFSPGFLNFRVIRQSDGAWVGNVYVAVLIHAGQPVLLIDALQLPWQGVQEGPPPPMGHGDGLELHWQLPYGRELEFPIPNLEEAVRLADHVVDALIRDGEQQGFRRVWLGFGSNFGPLVTHLQDRFAAGYMRLLPPIAPETRSQRIAPVTLEVYQNQVRQLAEALRARHFGPVDSFTYQRGFAELWTSAAPATQEPTPTPPPAPGPLFDAPSTAPESVLEPVEPILAPLPAAPETPPSPTTPAIVEPEPVEASRPSAPSPATAEPSPTAPPIAAPRLHLMLRIGTGFWKKNNKGESVPIAEPFPLTVQGVALGPDGLLYVTSTKRKKVTRDAEDTFKGEKLVELHRIEVFDRTGHPLRTIGGPGAGPGQFNEPIDIAVGPSGRLYIVDQRNQRIQILTPEGEYVRSFTPQGLEPGNLSHTPQAIAVDAAENIYVAIEKSSLKRQPPYDMIQVYTRDGQFLRSFGPYGTNPDELRGPRGLAVSPDGRVYVTDDVVVSVPSRSYGRSLGRIQVFSTEGLHLFSFSKPSPPHDPTESSIQEERKQERSPKRIAVGPSGLIYVTDTDQDEVQVFDRQGTFLARWGSQNALDPNHLSSPQGIAIDAQGHVFLADSAAAQILVLRTEQGETPPVPAPPHSQRGLFLAPAWLWWAISALTGVTALGSLDWSHMSVFGILLISATWHELAHGWVAKQFGDMTAERAGRLTLNPLKHLDPVGSVLLPLVLGALGLHMAGYMKPVPVNPRVLGPTAWRKVAAAGSLMNLGLAIMLGGFAWSAGADAPLLLTEAWKINLALGLINLLPIPGLDGWVVWGQRVWHRFAPQRSRPVQPTIPRWWTMATTSAASRLPALLAGLWNTACVIAPCRSVDIAVGRFALSSATPEITAAQDEERQRILTGYDAILREFVEMLISGPLSTDLRAFVDQYAIDADSVVEAAHEGTDAALEEELPARVQQSPVNEQELESMLIEQVTTHLQNTVFLQADRTTVKRLLTEALLKRGVPLSRAIMEWLEQERLPETLTRFYQSSAYRAHRRTRSHPHDHGHGPHHHGTSKPPETLKSLLLPLLGLGLGTMLGAAWGIGSTPWMLTTADEPPAPLPAPDPLERFQLTAREREILNEYTKPILEIPPDNPFVGRAEELAAVERSLNRPPGHMNSVILLGKPGVGKTAIVHALAERMASGQGPVSLRNRQIRVLEAHLTGDLDRLKDRVFAELLPVLRKTRNGVILFIDEFQSLAVEIGNTRDTRVLNSLKSDLAAGRITLIGATTDAEFRQFIEPDQAFVERFTKVSLEEPDPVQMLTILNGIKADAEQKWGIQIEEEALRTLVELTDRFLPLQTQPRKALKNLGAALGMLTASDSHLKLFMDDLAKRLAMHIDVYLRRVQAQRATAADATKLYNQIAAQVIDLQKLKAEYDLLDMTRLTANDVRKHIAQLTHIDLAQLTEDQAKRLEGMEGGLREWMVGQDKAVTTISEAVRRAKAGMQDSQRPMGVFLFAGPTGTGKTELAKALARFLFGDERSLVRLDMSEYQESHTISRLFGSPPGYVGYYEGGQLTEAVKKRPHCVILLDEIEKAHPRVKQAFLQVFDDGRMTSGKGETVDFRNTVIIMTSNIGMQDLKNSSKYQDLIRQWEENPNPEEVNKLLRGLNKLTGEAVDTVKGEHFTPEFINRITETIVFDALTPAELIGIAKIYIRKNLARLLEQQGYYLELSEEVYRLLAQQGFTPDMGARPLQGVVRKLLENPLAKQLIHWRANGQVLLGGTIHVSVDRSSEEPKLRFVVEEGKSPLLERRDLSRESEVVRRTVDAVYAEVSRRAAARTEEIPLDELKTLLGLQPAKEPDRQPAEPEQRGAEDARRQPKALRPYLPDTPPADELAIPRSHTSEHVNATRPDTGVAAFQRTMEQQLAGDQRLAQAAQAWLKEFVWWAKTHIPEGTVSLELGTGSRDKELFVIIARWGTMESAERNLLLDTLSLTPQSAEDIQRLAIGRRVQGKPIRRSLLELKLALQRISGASFGHVVEGDQTHYWLRLPLPQRTKPAGATTTTSTGTRQVQNELTEEAMREFFGALDQPVKQPPVAAPALPPVKVAAPPSSGQRPGAPPVIKPTPLPPATTSAPPQEPSRQESLKATAPSAPDAMAPLASAPSTVAVPQAQPSPSAPQPAPPAVKPSSTEAPPGPPPPSPVAATPTSAASPVGTRPSPVTVSPTSKATPAKSPQAAPASELLEFVAPTVLLPTEPRPAPQPSAPPPTDPLVPMLLRTIEDLRQKIPEVREVDRAKANDGIEELSKAALAHSSPEVRQAATRALVALQELPRRVFRGLNPQLLRTSHIFINQAGDLLAAYIDEKSYEATKYKPEEKAKCSIWIWNIRSEEPYRKFPAERGSPYEKAIYQAALSPNGKLLVTNGASGVTKLQLWDVGSGVQVGKIEGLAGPLAAISFCGNGRCFATISRGTGNGSAYAQRWDVVTGRPTHTISLRGSPVTVAVDATGNQMANAVTALEGKVTNVEIWRDPFWKAQHVFTVPYTDYSGRLSLTFSPDGRLLACVVRTAGDPPLSTVYVWDATTGELVSRFRGATAIAFHPTELLVATGSSDGEVYLWASVTGPLRLAMDLLAGQGWVNSLAFNGDGSRLAVGGAATPILIGLKSLPGITNPRQPSGISTALQTPQSDVVSPVRVFTDPTLKRPLGVIVDAQGAIYVAAEKAVHRFSAAGRHEKAFPLEVDEPYGIAIDQHTQQVVMTTSKWAGFNNVLLMDAAGHLTKNAKTQIGGHIRGIAQRRDGTFFVAVSNVNEVVPVRVTEGAFEAFLPLWITNDPPRAMSSPHHVAIDAADRLYVSDETHRVHVFDRDGHVLRLLGRRGTAPGAFENPRGLAVDDGAQRLYVADTGNHRIQIFDLEGNWLGAFGLEGNQPGLFRSPEGLALDTHGNLYVADTQNNRLQVFSRASLDAVPARPKLQPASTAQPGPEPTQFNSAYLRLYQPVALTFDRRGYAYIADRTQAWVVSPAGRVERCITPFRDWKKSSWTYITQLALDDTRQRLYVVHNEGSSGNGRSRVEIYDLEGKPVGAFDKIGWVRHLKNARGIAVLPPSGRIAVTEVQYGIARKARILLFAPEGQPLHVGPWIEVSDTGDNLRLAPTKDGKLLMIDKQDQLYVLDAHGTLQRTIDGKTAGLKSAAGLAVDAAGQIYVADPSAKGIVVLEPDGRLVRTLGENLPPKEQLMGPTAIAFTPSGDVAVLESDGRRVRLFPGRDKKNWSWLQPQWLEDLKGSDRAKTIRAVKALGATGDPKAVEPLRQFFTPARYQNPRELDLLIAATQALGQLKELTALPTLLWVFEQRLPKDQHYPELFEATVAAIAALGSEVVEPLAARLTPEMYDSQRWVTLGIVQALGQLGDRRAVERLAWALQAKNRRSLWWSDVREAAVAALVATDAPEVIPALEGSLTQCTRRDNDTKTATLIEQALATLRSRGSLQELQRIRPATDFAREARLAQRLGRAGLMVPAGTQTVMATPALLAQRVGDAAQIELKGEVFRVTFEPGMPDIQAIESLTTGRREEYLLGQFRRAQYTKEALAEQPFSPAAIEAMSGNVYAFDLSILGELVDGHFRATTGTFHTKVQELIQQLEQWFGQTWAQQAHLVFVHFGEEAEVPQFQALLRSLLPDLTAKIVNVPAVPQLLETLDQTYGAGTPKMIVLQDTHATPPGPSALGPFAAPTKPVRFIVVGTSPPEASAIVSGAAAVVAAIEPTAFTQQPELAERLHPIPQAASPVPAPESPSAVMELLPLPVTPEFRRTEEMERLLLEERLRQRWAALRPEVLILDA